MGTTRKKTHQQYVNELSMINPSIEVVEQYMNSNTKIKHRCRNRQMNMLHVVW